MIQNTQETIPKTSILSEKLFKGLKWVIFVIIVVMIYRAFQQKHQSLSDIITAFQKAFVWKNTGIIFLLILLIFINWGFEALKWQILAKKIEVISFSKAYQSVLVGLSLGFITPANVGDFTGKIWYLKSKNKSETVGTILLGNGIQFYVSLIFGVISYIIIWQKSISVFDHIIFGLLIFALVLGILVYVKRFKLIDFLQKKSWLKNYKNHLNAFVLFNLKEISTLFLWSILRYLTFSLQFVLMLWLFEVKINLIYLWAISCLVFLFKTIIPAINFMSDLGVREYTAMYFFSLFSVNITSVISATFCLWLLNILLPVSVGGLLILGTKNK